MIRLLATYLRPYRRALALVVTLQLVQSAASLFLPTINAAIIDNGVATGDTGYIWALAEKERRNIFTNAVRR